jgi:peptide-methionine (S)-S-oxide reductase
MTERATFAAGCFWGVEAEFRKIEGVVATTVGYTGGTVANPSYELVCTDTTNHAEAVLVEYDPGQVSYEQLLEVFWTNHDPTQVDRQGPDVGRQYRSAVYFHGPEQEVAANRSKAEAQSRFPRPIATEIVPAAEFYPAEDYHQRYLEKRGMASCAVTVAQGATAGPPA